MEQDSEDAPVSVDQSWPLLPNVSQRTWAGLWSAQDTAGAVGMSEHCRTLRAQVEASGPPNVHLSQSDAADTGEFSNLIEAILGDMEVTVAFYHVDTSWSQDLAQRGAQVVVQSTASGLDETLAYAQRLVDMYDDPKKLSVFLHGSSPSDWHSHKDILDTIARIDADKLLAMGGYASLNLKMYSGPEGALGGQSEALQYRVDCLWRDKPWVKMMRERWAIQDGDFHDWAGYCCGQFALHRDTLRSYPKEFYNSLLETMQTPQPRTKHSHWSVIGRSMEYLWHVMFNGKPIRERHYDADNFTSS